MTSLIAKGAGAFSLTIFLSLSAQAATLEAIKGGVMVSRGGGAYQTVDKPTALSAGDSVIANPGAAARVVFENGCTDTVQPGMVYRVPESPLCHTGSNPPDYSYGSLKDAVPVVEERDYTALAVGAAVVAGGVGIAILASGDDDDDDRVRIPSSP